MGGCGEEIWVSTRLARAVGARLRILAVEPSLLAVRLATTHRCRKTLERH